MIILKQKHLNQYFNIPPKKLAAIAEHFGLEVDIHPEADGTPFLDLPKRKVGEVKGIGPGTVNSLRHAGYHVYEIVERMFAMKQDMMESRRLIEKLESKVNMHKQTIEWINNDPYGPRRSYDKLLEFHEKLVTDLCVTVNGLVELAAAGGLDMDKVEQIVKTVEKVGYIGHHTIQVRAEHAKPFVWGETEDETM